MTAAAFDDNRGPEAPTNARLWVAVILQAVRDGIDKSNSASAMLNRARARSWFQQTSPQSDFYFVCERAEMDPEQVAKHAAAVFAKADRGEFVQVGSKGGTNKRSRITDRRYTFEGKTFTLTEWSELTDIPRKTLETRIRNGWRIERALTELTPSQRGLQQRAANDNHPGAPTMFERMLKTGTPSPAQD